MRRAALLPLLALLPVLAARGVRRRRRLGHDDERLRDDDDRGASRRQCSDGLAPTRRAGERTADKPTTSLDPSKTYKVTMETNCGDFTITLDQEQSPKRPRRSSRSSNKGFYDNTVFHRIVPDFVIQGGDPTATGTGGPGYSTVDTPPADAKYTHGVVAMAKTRRRAGGHGRQPVLRRDRRRRGPAAGLRDHRHGHRGARRRRRDRQARRARRAADRRWSTIEKATVSRVVTGDRRRRARGRRGHALRLARSSSSSCPYVLDRLAATSVSRRRRVEGAYPIPSERSSAACAS